MSGLHDALQALIDGRSLTDAEAELAIGEIMDGGASDAVVGAFLVALKIKGAEADELAGAVRAMLAARASAESSRWRRARHLRHRRRRRQHLQHLDRRRVDRGRGGRRRSPSTAIARSAAQ